MGRVPLGPDVHSAHQASSPLSAVAGKGSCFPCRAMSPSPCPESGGAMYTPGAPVGPQRVRRLAMSPRDASPPQRGHPLAAVTASPAGHLLSALDLVCGRHTGLATVGAESWWGAPRLAAGDPARGPPGHRSPQRRRTHLRSTVRGATGSASPTSPAPPGGLPSLSGVPRPDSAVPLCPLGLESLLRVCRWGLTPRTLLLGTWTALPPRERLPRLVVLVKLQVPAGGLCQCSASQAGGTTVHFKNKCYVMSCEPAGLSSQLF